MRRNTDVFSTNSMPVFIEKTQKLMEYIQGLNYEEAKAVWKCNDKIAKLNFDRFNEMDLDVSLTPALLAYEGIQYQYMSPEVFDYDQWEYIENHLYILSGFYGLVKPFDGVVPYRLEMQAKISVNEHKDLYEFWGTDIYDHISKETDCIINLASKEYSKCIEKYLDGKIKFVNCIFGEYKEGKVIEKGTQVKMARGEMVRFMTENFVESEEKLKDFKGLGFRFSEGLSNEYNFIFLK